MSDLQIKVDALAAILDSFRKECKADSTWIALDEKGGLHIGLRRQNRVASWICEENNDGSESVQDALSSIIVSVDDVEFARFQDIYPVTVGDNARDTQAG